IEASDRDKLLELCKLDKKTGPETWWLTEFEDKSSPRPGTADLYFSVAGDQNPVARPDHIQYVAARVPNCVMTYALLGYMLVPCVVRVVRRRIR
ncbi:MAG TPA: hypothetical protein VE988_14735, partial [Gemmataceae bacterium]|nr:hypothetical protein [Gemmataceae bacterium]